MNGSVKCVEKHGRNIECMHVKCKFVVIVVWNKFTRIKFHVYHLVTILWGIFFLFFFSTIGRCFTIFVVILWRRVFRQVVLFFNSEIRKVC